MASAIPKTPDEQNEDDDGAGWWCMTCGDEFHLDDIGGYNPPCSCGLHCRSCHEQETMEAFDDDDGYDDDPYYPEDET